MKKFNNFFTLPPSFSPLVPPVLVIELPLPNYSKKSNNALFPSPSSQLVPVVNLPSSASNIANELYDATTYSSLFSPTATDPKETNSHAIAKSKKSHPLFCLNRHFLF